MESVLAQTFEDFELIVVDDGSTDQTGEALAPFASRIKLITINHSGVSAARNAGLARARGRLIAFLDSDDYWLPAKLETEVRFFEKYPEAQICQTEEIWIRNGRRVNPRKKHRKPTGDIFIPSLRLCLVSPSAVMIRRELLGQVGLFDETLPACEDYDLWLRISASHPVHLIDEPLVVKTGGHQDQLSRTTIGLDQYRIRAILKILESGILNREQVLAAQKELKFKAAVYSQGCLKRGKAREAEKYLALARI